MYKKLLPCIFLLGASSAIFADNRVKELPGKYSVRIGTTLPSIPLEISSDSFSVLYPDFDYEQNPAPKMGIGLDYSWWGFYISFRDLKTEEDVDLYGSTDYFDFQLHSYLGKWGIDLYLQDFKGYHIKLPPSGLGSLTPVIRSDLETQYLGVNVFYVYHPERMSLVATGNGTAIQTSSGGSWMLQGAIGKQKFESDAVLAPPGLETKYGKLGNIQVAEFSTASFGGGYGYNGVLGGPWYLHISALLALGPQYQKYSTRDYGDATKVVLSSKATARVALGFSAEKYFGAVSVVSDTTFFKVDTTSLNFVSTQSFAYIGRRF